MICTDIFAPSQSDARVSVAYNSSQWKQDSPLQATLTSYIHHIHRKISLLKLKGGKIKGKIMQWKEMSPLNQQFFVNQKKKKKKRGDIRIFPLPLSKFLSAPKLNFGLMPWTVAAWNSTSYFGQAVDIASQLSLCLIDFLALCRCKSLPVSLFSKDCDVMIPCTMHHFDFDLQQKKIIKRRK